MSPLPVERWRRVESLFLGALPLAEAERIALLERECAGDEELRGEVEELLRADARNRDGFLRAPAAGAVLGPGDRVGGYRIEQVLASGGMGVVYTARQESPRRRVALKVLRPGLPTRDAVRRFRFEAEVLGSLRHPGIAQVFEAGTHDLAGATLPWFAMELVQGAQPITAWAEGEGLGERERVELLVRVCDAVHHGHLQGVVHRDLKPDNVLVDASGAVKVIDFGVARVTEGELAPTTRGTRAGEILGTLATMSPELCVGDSRDVDARTDVYSLGVLLYELLTGELPIDIEGRPLVEALRSIQEDPPGRSPRLVGDLEIVAFKCLEKDREQRYGSAAEVAADLGRWLAAEPIQARRPSATRQLRLFARRHRALVGSVCVVFLVLVAATVLTSRYALLASERAERVEAERALAAASAGFLEEILLTAAPVNAVDADGPLTLRDLLDGAAANVGERLASHPSAEARMRTLIADAYRQLSRVDEAEVQLARALEIARGLTGPTARRLEASALIKLAAVEVKGGRPAQAIASTERALELVKGLPEDPELRLQAWNVLGVACFYAGELEASIEWHQRALALRREQGRPVPVSESLVNLGNAFHQLGREDAAEEVWTEACALLREHAPDHAFLGTTLSNLGWIRYRAGDLEGAEQAIVEGIAILARRYGESGPELAGPLRKLALLEVRREDFDAADANFRRAIELLQGAESRFDLAGTLADHAYSLTRRGRFAEAQPVAERSVALFAELVPDSNPTAAAPLYILGLCALRLGDPAGALVHVQRCHDLRAAAFGSQHWQTANSASLLGECLLDLGRVEEAAPWIEDSQAVLERSLGTGHLLVEDGQARLARLRNERSRQTKP